MLVIIPAAFYAGITRFFEIPDAMCIWQRRTSTLATIGAVTIHIEEIGTARPSELALVVGGNRFQKGPFGYIYKYIYTQVNKHMYINIDLERCVSIKGILLHGFREKFMDCCKSHCSCEFVEAAP